MNAAVDDMDMDTNEGDAAEGGALVEQEAPRALATNPPQGVAPLVQMLAGGGYSTEEIRELLAIQREHKADIAREAYAEALARFRAVAPTLAKDRTVDFTSAKGRTSYRHTSLGYTMSTVNPLLGELGLNLSWHPRVEGNTVHVETRLTHALGHTESITLPGAPDQSGNKNAIQAMKSTITYLERTGAFALLGIASDDDDDGRGAAHAAASEPPPPEPEPEISESQVLMLVDLLDAIDDLSPGYRRKYIDSKLDKFEATDTPLGFTFPARLFDKAREKLEQALREAQARAEEAGEAEESAEGGDA